MSKASLENDSIARPVTDSEEETIREEIDHVLVANASSNYGGKLHIGDGEGEPICLGYTLRRGGQRSKYADQTWREKAPAVYPPGHREFCQFCVAHWREGKL